MTYIRWWRIPHRNYSVEEAMFEAVCTTQGWYHKKSRINRVTSGESTIREKTNKILNINIIITVWTLPKENDISIFTTQSYSSSLIWCYHSQQESFSQNVGSIKEYIYPYRFPGWMDAAHLKSAGMSWFVEPMFASKDWDNGRLWWHLKNCPLLTSHCRR